MVIEEEEEEEEEEGRTTFVQFFCSFEFFAELIFSFSCSLFRRMKCKLFYFALLNVEKAYIFPQTHKKKS
jgi:hypothetical protein